MRLLQVGENGEFSLTKDVTDNIPHYAILSHTWGNDDDEVNFEDLTKGPRRTKAGYRKLSFCAKQAARDGLQHFWVDTCCINKSNNTELSEAINSMFRWYRNATRCYVYLSDVSTDDHDQINPSLWKLAFRRSRWFTRGWTLQELIAPLSVEFFCSKSNRLGDKRSLERQLHEITGIAIQALRGTPLSEFSVNERMSWAKARQTKREEDKAYSLLGIFDVYMPLIYGEGAENAIRRLREEIDKSSRPIPANMRAGLSWFYNAFDSMLKVANWSLEGWKNTSHLHNEDLLGYSNTTVFQSWLQQGGSILWCRPMALEPVHDSIATRLARQAKEKISYSGCSVHVFTFSCCRVPRVELPTAYAEIRCKVFLARGNLFNDDPRREKLLKSNTADLVETMLLTLLAQAEYGGFRPDLRFIDLSNPQRFVNSMADIFTTAVCRQPGRVLIVVEHAEIIDESDRIANTDAVRRFCSAISSIFPHKDRSKCSVIISATPTPAISAGLMGHPVVQSDSEYQECLKSLSLTERNARRREIENAIVNTNLWIWNHPAFTKLMGDKSGALAIIGKAGSGKSVLAKTIQRDIIQNANRPSSDMEVIVTDWFYCRRRGDIFISYLSLLKSVLYEVLSHTEGKRLFPHYKVPYRRLAPDPARKWMECELEGILISLAGSGTSLVMIFDGIDEARDDQMTSFVQRLVNYPGSSIKVIMLSRPLAAFKNPFWAPRQISLQELNHKDICSIITDRLSTLRRTLSADTMGPSGDAAWPTQEHAVLAKRIKSNPSYVAGDSASETDIRELESILTNNAKGVILWVVLVFDSFFKFIEDKGKVTIQELTEHVDNVRVGIEEFYEQMVHNLSSKAWPNGPNDLGGLNRLKEARKSLMWVNAANEIKQLTFGELWDALAIPDDLSTYPVRPAKKCPIILGRKPVTSWGDFRVWLEGCCGSFIEVLPATTGQESEHSVVQLIHQTAKDFLTSSAKAGPLGFTETEAVDMMHSRCVSYIRSVIPKPPLTFPPFDLIHNDPKKWHTYLACLAIYLEEYRLLELCSAVVSSRPRDLNLVRYQTDLILSAFLPQSVQQFYQTPGDLVYDQTPFETKLVSSAFSHLFHFITAHGLVQSVRNVASLIKLRNDNSVVAIYEDAILHGILFTAMDHDVFEELTGGILAPGGWRPQGPKDKFERFCFREKCDRELGPGVPYISAAVDDIVNASNEVITQLPSVGYSSRREDIEKLLRLLTTRRYLFR